MNIQIHTLCHCIVYGQNKVAFLILGLLYSPFLVFHYVKPQPVQCGKVHPKGLRKCPAQAYLSDGNEAGQVLLFDLTLFSFILQFSEYLQQLDGVG